MSLEVLGMLLDLLVLGFLGAMIFYSLRLSKSLNDFRAHRQEFDSIIIKLMSSIDQAERSISNLKQVSARETEDLNRLLKQSKALSEELQIINEAGESMAKRLEELAEKNRKVVQRVDLHDVDLSETPSERYKPYKPPKASDQKQIVKEGQRPQPKDFPSFMMRDPESPPVETMDKGLESSVNNDYPRSGTERLQSQAEKDLYNALRGNKGNPQPYKKRT